ncbi:pyridoxal-dependent decarboxylase [Pyronema domesticum]|uniref:Ornithine decarboxylase n=1 Tax=Pyronema omphalodes (strain CBS 100304) TaxID=1076935 RepID=U4LFJ8_PYROM|nr:pyridoxal-dependent decarboxylase [Pyronema domesticum]CCX14237.1 Similar to Ornithine decarboxylase; acc. no. P27121 [Pyronema omphalodes CBS 100304]
MSPSEISTWPIPSTTSTVASPIAPRCPTVMAPSTQQRRFSQASANTKQRAQMLIAKALETRVNGINPDECDAGSEDAFFVADLGDVYRQHMRWKVNLPRIEPFYAVKCNGDPKVLELLASLGTGFDCASKAEIEQVLGMGIDPQRIIYANPCKTPSYVRWVAESGVRMLTFDNAEELYKIKRFYPTAQCVLRISTDDSKALCRLSLKYGCPLDDTAKLLALAKELELDVIGVSFHVGSGSEDPSAFITAVEDARTVFDQAAEIGFEFNLLDVGGGYGTHNFEEIAGGLGPAVDKNFPPSVRVIAEPGRYYVATAFTLATHIIARRTVQDEMKGDLPSYMLYQNDGVYGNFSNIIFDHQNPVAKVLKDQNGFYYNSQPENTRLTEYSIWGPTCDGIDCITKSCYLPAVLDDGDWLYYTDMGAYSKCSATKFNGFSNDHDTVYVVSEPGAKALLDM